MVENAKCSISVSMQSAHLSTPILACMLVRARKTFVPLTVESLDPWALTKQLMHAHAPVFLLVLPRCFAGHRNRSSMKLEFHFSNFIDGCWFQIKGLALCLKWPSELQFQGLMHDVTLEMRESLVFFISTAPPPPTAGRDRGIA